MINTGRRDRGTTLGRGSPDIVRGTSVTGLRERDQHGSSSSDNVIARRPSLSIRQSVDDIAQPSLFIRQSDFIRQSVMTRQRRHLRTRAAAPGPGRLGPGAKETITRLLASSLGVPKPQGRLKAPAPKPQGTCSPDGSHVCRKGLMCAHPAGELPASCHLSSRGFRVGDLRLRPLTAGGGPSEKERGGKERGVHQGPARAAARAPGPSWVFSFLVKDGSGTWGSAASA